MRAVCTPLCCKGFIVPINSFLISSHAHQDNDDNNNISIHTIIRHISPGKFADPTCTSSAALLMITGAIGSRCHVTHAMITEVRQVMSDGMFRITSGYPSKITAEDIVIPI